MSFAIASALCACTAQKEAKPDNGKVAQAGAPATAAVSHGSFDPVSRVAVIHAKDFAFDAPDSITAGWTTLRLVNDGPGLHHVQLVRLDSGKTVDDLARALKNPGPPPRWAVFVGGANAPDPHSESAESLDLQAGQYVLLCLVDIPDHVPHFAKGMVHPLTVTAAPANAATGAEPKADVTVTLNDYAFVVQGALTPGKHTIKVVNSGPQPHELELARFAPGKHAPDLGAWINKPDGPPPGNALGGVTALAPGAAGYFDVDLTAGNYGFFCFLPDAKDGKPHVEHGMVKEMTVQ